VLSFEGDSEAETNIDQMTRALAQVGSGQVTRAVRDSQIDGLAITAGDYLGIYNHKIVVSEADLLLACRLLFKEMIGEDTETITIFYGEEADGKRTDELLNDLRSSYPDLNIEIHEGGQPVYEYIISVE